MARSRVDFSLTSKSTYKLFKQENPDINISYLEYVNIIYSFNYAFRDYLMETGMKGKLPWGIGDFAVSKRRPKKIKIMPDGSEKMNLPVDWAKSRNTGKRIYHFNFHTEGYKFRIKWFPKKARFEYSELFVFKPSRITSRLIKHYIDMGYQDKYYEWDLVK